MRKSGCCSCVGSRAITVTKMSERFCSPFSESSCCSCCCCCVCTVVHKVLRYITAKLYKIQANCFSKYQPTLPHSHIPQKPTAKYHTKQQHCHNTSKITHSLTHTHLLTQLTCATREQSSSSANSTTATTAATSTSLSVSELAALLLVPLLIA